jgi:hypothetical protein
VSLPKVRRLAGGGRLLLLVAGRLLLLLDGRLALSGWWWDWRLLLFGDRWRLLLLKGLCLNDEHGGRHEDEPRS